LLIISIILFLLNYLGNDEEEVIQTNDRDNSVLQVVVLNDFINIRSDKSKDSSLLGKVYEGEIYTVIEKINDGEWYLIETSNNIRGYVAGKYGEEDYVSELDVIGEELDNSSDINQNLGGNTNNGNNNSNNKPNTNVNNQSKPNSGSSTNNSGNQSSDSSSGGNNDDVKDETPKLPACLKTCDSGYELKNKDSVDCYCEKIALSYVTKNQVIYNSDGVVITVKGLDYSDKHRVILDLNIKNNSDVAKTIQKNNFPYVNGYDIATTYSVTLLPGTASNYGMTFLKSYLDKNGISEIQTIKLNFVIIDWDGSLETLSGAKKVKTPWIDLTF